ncbi:PLP-dependent lyase/thiolase [Candidatus Pacearchaeota archaeon]|nr:PLP-dependent lyase/thiolase [Candidatus Pacearchaeota archaeon]
MNKIKIQKPGNTPLVKLKSLFGVSNLFMKDETKNPTHTFKDRLAYEMIRPTIEAINNNQNFDKITFGSISYGNTASSMGHYCKKLNQLYKKEIVNAVAFVPPEIVYKPFGPNTEGITVAAKEVLRKISENCEIIEIDLKAQIYREKDLEKIAKKNHKVLDKFVDITEGLNRPAYVNIIIEAIEQLKKIPDYVIVPFGAGILCNEIIDYIEDNKLITKVIPVSSGNPETIAIMLYGPIWVDTESLLKKGSGWTKHDKTDRKGRIRKPYLVYHVDDDEIINAMKVLKQNSITAEASGARGFAILHRLNKIDSGFDSKKHSVLVINTGNGLLNFK